MDGYEYIPVLLHCMKHCGYCSQEHRGVIHTRTGQGVNWKSECVVLLL